MPAREPWSQRLRDHCSVRRLGEPTWQDVSDRRGKLCGHFPDFNPPPQLRTEQLSLDQRKGGRTAWSSIVVIQGSHYAARFWYDGAYMEQAREDAAEMALRHITGYVNTTQEPPSANQYARN